jgi:hypothetical protein
MPGTAMAKKRAGKPARPSPPPRDDLIAIRCTAAFKAFVEAMAREETRTPTQVIERALKEYAEKHGHGAIPER